MALIPGRTGEGHILPTCASTDPQYFQLQNLKGAFRHHCFFASSFTHSSDWNNVTVALSGPHVFLCVRLPGHQSEVRALLTFHSLDEVAASSSLPSFSTCSSKADASHGEGLSPFSFLHNLLEARLSLALNYRYVITDILSVACESCYTTQIIYCVST